MPKRILTDEEKAVLRERLAKAREVKKKIDKQTREAVEHEAPYTEPPKPPAPTPEPEPEPEKPTRKIKTYKKNQRPIIIIENDDSSDEEIIIKPRRKRKTAENKKPASSRKNASNRKPLNDALPAEAGASREADEPPKTEHSQQNPARPLQNPTPAVDSIPVQAVKPQRPQMSPAEIAFRRQMGFLV
jgi:hypothetical protein